MNKNPAQGILKVVAPALLRAQDKSSRPLTSNQSSLRSRAAPRDVAKTRHPLALRYAYQDKSTSI